MNDGPEETLRAYVQAFESLDPDAVVPFYHQPCLFVSPFGVSLAADAGAARGIVSQLVEHARSQGYRRTQIRGLEVKELADSVALLSGTFVRFGAGDGEIGRFGFVYVLHRGAGGWRIAVAVGHGVPAATA